MAVKRNQYDRIMTHLDRGNSLSAAQATRWGISNLRARICELRDAGFHIVSTPKRVGKGVMYRKGTQN